MWKCRNYFISISHNNGYVLLAASSNLIPHRYALIYGPVAFCSYGFFSLKEGFCGQNVQVVANLAGRVADVGDPCPGAMHDSRAFEASGIAERWARHYETGGFGMTGDKGYQGTGVKTPYKKPRGRELGDVRRSCNKSLNSLRAAVERAIEYLKCWKVLKTGFRRSLEEFPQVLRTVTKLEMYRVYGLH